MTTDHGPLTTDHGPLTSDDRLSSPDSRLRTPDFRLSVFLLRSPVFRTNIFAALAYPLFIEAIPLHGSTVHLYVPEPVALQQQYLQQKEKDPHTPFPYWAKLWPAGIGLARFVLAHPQYVAGKQVLELAAGLGLPSLVAAEWATQVCCTDSSAEAVEAATQSAAIAGRGNMICETLNWNELPHPLPAVHTLLLSDVNYEPSVFESLLQVIHRFWEQGTTILLTTPQRLVAGTFVTELASYQPVVHTLQVPHTGGHTAISLYVLSPREAAG